MTFRTIMDQLVEKIWMMSLKLLRPLKHVFSMLRPQITIRSIIFVLMDQTVGVATRGIKTNTNTRMGLLDYRSIVDFIKPVFQDLSRIDLLTKCTRGLTQNVNECLNGLIWDGCPKICPRRERHCGSCHILGNSKVQ